MLLAGCGGSPSSGATGKAEPVTAQRGDEAKDGALSPPAPHAGHHEVPDDRPLSGPAPLTSLRRTGSRRWGAFESVQVNVNALGENIPGDAANEPSIAVDPTNPARIVIGWRQFDTIASNFRKAGWAYSHDGGRTWTFPGTLEPNEFASDPVVEADADGNFYYYSLQSNRGPIAFSCYLYKSFDGGVTWPQETFAWGGDKAWMAIDRTDGIGRGNVYAIFDEVGSPADFTRSTDGGLTFSEPIFQISPWGTLTVGPDGELYVCGRQPEVVRSDNARDPAVMPTFTAPTFVDLGGGVVSSAGPNPGGLLGQVWIDCDRSSGPRRGSVYLLASVNPAGTDPLDVKFARSSDGGASWSAPVRINSDPPAGHAWQWFGTMAVAPGGRIDVIWNDTRDDSTVTFSQLYYSNSFDGGLTWSPNVPLSPPFNHYLGYPNQNKLGDYYDMVSLDSSVYIAYAATFNGEQDVYFVRIDFDCNSNGTPDHDDIAGGTSEDCTGNGIPDECEPDCNGNETADTCDIASGASVDCTSNGTPDECEPDCNANGDADSCDIAGGTRPDCHGNGVPDECELTGNDCNENGTPDDCEILAGIAGDCRPNGTPDECEIAGHDCDSNGTHDDCDAGVVCEPDAFASGTDMSTACYRVVLSVASTGEPVHAVQFPLDPGANKVFGSRSGNYQLDEAGMRAQFAAPVSAASIDVIADDANDGASLRGYTSTGALCDTESTGGLSAGQSRALTVSCAEPIASVVVSTSFGVGNALYDRLVVHFPADCDRNGVPDECEPDCNTNGLGDGCDILQGASQDCNHNAVPDECDLAAGTSHDCTENALPDECDLDASREFDCNSSGVPDSCEIEAGTSSDCDGDLVPDECDFDLCFSNLWSGFEPFSSGMPLNGLDYNGDGNAWSNPSLSWTISAQGCPSGQGQAAKGVSRTPPLVNEHVRSEPFVTGASGGLRPRTPQYRFLADLKLEASLNPRIDWQILLKDRSDGDGDPANDPSVILIHLPSTQSAYVGVASVTRGRILVRNPDSATSFLTLTPPHVLMANQCFRIAVELDNLAPAASAVRLYVNGSLRLVTKRLSVAANRIDYLQIQQVANGQASGVVNRLGLDNVTLCERGGTLAPGGLADCNQNGVLDRCDITAGTSGDCNANSLPDECDAPALISAASHSPNSGTGETCMTEAVLAGTVRSEAHRGRISELRFTFGGDASGACLSSIEQATCAAPAFVPYAGNSVPQCAAVGSELICTFTPALENLRTYRFNLTGGSATIRGLAGDVNSDGVVDALDRALVVGVWTSPAGFSCETDVDSSGSTNAVDRAFVVGAWTAPQNCAP